MVDIVRCQTSHSGHAVPMARPLCMEEGCTRPVKAQGRCNACYCRWYASPDFTPVPKAEPRPLPNSPGVCPWCGPYTRSIGQGSTICPTCDLDPGEHAYIDRILVDSSAVYAEEARAYRANQQRGGS